MADVEFSTTESSPGTWNFLLLRYSLSSAVGKPFEDKPSLSIPPKLKAWELFCNQLRSQETFEPAVHSLPLQTLFSFGSHGSHPRDLLLWLWPLSQSLSKAPLIPTNLKCFWRPSVCYFQIISPAHPLKSRPEYSKWLTNISPFGTVAGTSDLIYPTWIFLPVRLPVIKTVPAHGSPEFLLWTAQAGML